MPKCFDDSQTVQRHHKGHRADALNYNSYFSGKKIQTKLLKALQTPISPMFWICSPC